MKDIENMFEKYDEPSTFVSREEAAGPLVGEKRTFYNRDD